MNFTYYVIEASITAGLLNATNHGSDPFEGSVTICTDHIVSVVEHHRSTLDSMTLLPGATDDTWIADIGLVNGDHIWLYDFEYGIAGQVTDLWFDYQRKVKGLTGRRPPVQGRRPRLQ